MKPWSVRGEPNSALWWQAAMEHCFLTLAHAFTGGSGAVHACKVRASCRNAVPRPFSWMFSQGEEKRGEKRTSGRQRQKNELWETNNELSETSWTSLVSPKALLQEFLLTRMCHTSMWGGSAPGREGTQWVRGMPQSQTSHFCGTVWEITQGDTNCCSLGRYPT